MTTFKIKLTGLQHEVLIGLLLGDGSLKPSESKIDTDRPATFCLRVSQANTQQKKAYVFHLYEIFKDLTLSPPKLTDFEDKRNTSGLLSLTPQKKYEKWSFSTRQLPCFRFYGHQFYNKNGDGERIKVIPKQIFKWLTPRAIAYWYMDDGAAKWQGHSLSMRFCTDCFSLSEVNLLRKVLQDKHLVRCTNQKQRKGYRIATAEETSQRLIDLIFDHVLQEMRYKLPRSKGNKKDKK